MGTHTTQALYKSKAFCSLTVSLGLSGSIGVCAERLVWISNVDIYCQAMSDDAKIECVH